MNIGELKKHLVELTKKELINKISTASPASWDLLQFN